MTANEINKIRRSVYEQQPLIHCITNPISINQCANAVLAVGARPIMAEHPKETGEITKTAQALVLNLGNITDARMQSMAISAETAAKNNIPFIIDVVGIACSGLRREFAGRLIAENRPDIIKGNYSEIYALYNTAYSSAGVDAEGSLSTDFIGTAAAKLAQKYQTVILASGKVDIVTDGKKLIYIKNGTPQLAAVTGTGCMLGTLCGCYLSASCAISAAATACAVLGICGQLSETSSGNGSFLINLLDNLSVITDEQTESKLNLEEKEIESI